MKIQYFPTQYGSLILNPETLEGITFNETDISQISLFNAGGVPLYITKNPHARESKPYHYSEIDTRTWEKLNRHTMEGSEKKAREIIERITSETENTPQFIQESNDMHDRKEYMTINSAA